MSTHHEVIAHATLTHLAAAGEVQSARIIGQSGGWGVFIESGNIARALAAKRGAMRHFARFETLVAYLKKLGIVQFAVDASQYLPASSHPAHARADASERMRRTHEAMAHDQWFRQQVEQAINEADAPDAVWIDHSVVKEDMAKQRAALLCRIAGEAA